MPAAGQRCKGGGSPQITNHTSPITNPPKAASAAAEGTTEDAEGHRGGNGGSEARMAGQACPQITPISADSGRVGRTVAGGGMEWPPQIINHTSPIIYPTKAAAAQWRVSRWIGGATHGFSAGSGAAGAFSTVPSPAGADLLRAALGFGFWIVHAVSHWVSEGVSPWSRIMSSSRPGRWAAP